MLENRESPDFQELSDPEELAFPLPEDDAEVSTLQDNLCPPGSTSTSPPGL